MDGGDDELICVYDGYATLYAWIVYISERFL